MTPQERELVADLFDRLSRLEGSPRDADAERVIEDGLRRAPHAIYALVQTVLVQDEVLKRANERIQELESQPQGGAEPPRQGGFLDSMRDAILGPREQPRGGSVPSVPSVRSQQDSVWGSSGGYANPPPPPPATGYPPQGGLGQGGSFLGTAASAAAGVIGGALLLDGIRSMFGHQHGGAFGAYAPDGAVAPTPWADSSRSDLAREAGLNDIGRGHDGARDAAGQDRAGLMDVADDDSDVADADFDTDDGDFGGDDNA